MKVCPKCNTTNSDQAEYCSNCGAELPAPMLALVCPHCGKVNALGTSECSVCHTKLQDVRPEMTQVGLTKPQRKWWLKPLTVMVIVILAGWMFYNMRSNNLTYMAPSYLGIRFQYMGGEAKPSLYDDYYILYRNPQKRITSHYGLAYLGRDKIGRQRLKLSGPEGYKKMYQNNSHYQLIFDKNVAYLTGPDRQKIMVKSGKISTDKWANLNINIPDGKYRCYDDKHPEKKTVQMELLSSFR